MEGRIPRLRLISLVNKTRFLVLMLSFMLASYGVLAAGMANAAPTKLLNYQARITDPASNPVKDGTYRISFRIYNAATGGSVLWQEDQSVAIENGILDVQLGLSRALNLDFNSGRYYLGVRIENDSELSPRRAIGATPFALNSSLLDGRPIGIDPNNVLALDEGSNLNLPNNLTTSGNASIEGDASIDGSLTVGGTISAGSAITLGNISIGENGSIRFTGSDFEGFFDGNWHSLTVGGGDPVDLSGYCEVNAPCAGYAPATNSTVYANRQLDNLTGVAINTGLLPNTNNALNIGSSSLAWNNIFTSYLALSETTAPSALTNFGQLYIKSSDSSLYFQDDSGTEYNLLASGSGNVIGTGSANQITYWTGANTVGGSNDFTWNGTSFSVAGSGLFTGALSANSLTLTNPLAVASGGTGRNTLTTNGVLYGNGTSAINMTAAPTAGQVLLGNGSGVPTFTTITGDLTINGSGVATVSFGDYVEDISGGNGIDVTGSGGQGSNPTIDLGDLDSFWISNGPGGIALNNPNASIQLPNSSSFININGSLLRNIGPSYDHFGISPGSANGTSLLLLGQNGNMIQYVMGAVAPLATTATSGFFHFTATNGTPTGTPPSIQAGTVPMTYDVVNDTLYIYNGGSWQPVGGPGGGNFANRELDNLQNVAINTHLLPDSNDAYNLGSDALRWANLYIGESTEATSDSAIFLGNGIGDQAVIKWQEYGGEAGDYLNIVSSNRILLESQRTSILMHDGVTIDAGDGRLSMSDLNGVRINSPFRSIILTSPEVRMSGNLIQGSGLVTTDTDGFLYLNSMAGTPTGIPTSYHSSNVVPLTYDRTNNIIYIYNGGSWIPFTSGGGGGGNFANRELDNLQNTAINTDLLPNANNTHSLGSNTLRWKDIFIGSSESTGLVHTIHIGESLASEGTIHFFRDSNEFVINTVATGGMKVGLGAENSITAGLNVNSGTGVSIFRSGSSVTLDGSDNAIVNAIGHVVLESSGNILLDSDDQVLLNSVNNTNIDSGAGLNLSSTNDTNLTSDARIILDADSDLTFGAGQNMQFNSGSSSILMQDGIVLSTVLNENELRLNVDDGSALSSNTKITLQAPEVNLLGNLIQGAGLTTDATDGFLYLSSMEGGPTEEPTYYGGHAPITFDTLNDTLYVHNGFQWVPFYGWGGGGSPSGQPNALAVWDTGGNLTDTSSFCYQDYWQVSGNWSGGPYTYIDNADFSSRLMLNYDGAGSCWEDIANDAGKTPYVTIQTGNSWHDLTNPNMLQPSSQLHVGSNPDWSDAQSTGGGAFLFSWGEETYLSSGIAFNHTCIALSGPSACPNEFNQTDSFGAAAIAFSANGEPGRSIKFFTGAIDGVGLSNMDSYEAMRIDYNGDTTVNGSLFAPNMNILSGSVSHVCFDTATGEFGISSSPNCGLAIVSDARLKENIAYNLGGLSVVNQLKPARYNYIDDPTKHTGFIAQDILPFVPNAVSVASDGYYRLDAIEIVPFVVKATQELDLKVVSIKTKIDNLSVKVSALANKVNLLKTDVAGVKDRVTTLEEKINTAYPAKTNLPVTKDAAEVLIEWVNPVIEEDYSVFVTPNWNAGFWISDKNPTSFIIEFANPAPENARLDYKVEKLNN